MHTTLSRVQFMICLTLLSLIGVPAGLACTSNQECKAWRVCINHQCTAVPPKAAARKCGADNDCPGKEVCEASQCRLPSGDSAPAGIASKYPVEIKGKDGAPMRLVPAGDFVQGSNQGNGEQKVHLKDYYIDVYEVTIPRYVRFLQESGYRDKYGWNEDLLQKRKHIHDQIPWSAVSQPDAMAYCKFYEKRLPTQNEWEKAARGTDGRDYPWGDENPTPSHANYRKNNSPDKVSLKPVGSFEKGRSPYGMYDIAGNVAELVLNEDEGRRNDNSFFIIRGGSVSDGEELLLTWKEDPNGLCWEACQQFLKLQSPYEDPYNLLGRVVGFRCAMGPLK
jgi:formylglycine-generating enzyme required for sulfatase activity